MKITKQAALVIICINVLAVFGAVSLALSISARSIPDSGLSTERLDLAATRLAAQASQSAIAEVLHRDESYIRSLIRIGRAQQNLLCWTTFGFAFVAAVNLMYIFPVLFQSNRNA